MEQQYGSVIRGLQARAHSGDTTAQMASGSRYGAFVTLRGGMTRLVEALVSRMSGVTLRCQALVERVALNERGDSWSILLNHEESLEADVLCLALPAPRAARLVHACAPKLSRSLAEIPYESVATVNMVYRRSDIPHPLDSFGFVVPAAAQRSILGCSFSSVKFSDRAPEGSVVLRVYVGGAGHRTQLDLNDDALESLVREELRDLLGIDAAPRRVWIRRFTEAMPQYHVGHLDRVTAIEKCVGELPNLFLTGNAYHGVGIPDCVHHAEQTAARMMVKATKPSTRVFHQIRRCSRCLVK